MLNTREVALLIWVAVGLVALVVWCARSTDARQSVLNVLHALASPRLVGSLLGLYAYLALIVWAAYEAGAWEPALVSETVYWCLASGAVLWFRSNKITGEHRFVWRALRDVFAAALVLECIFELATFPLWVELLIQPVAALIFATLAVAETDEKSKLVASCLSGVVAIGGFAFLAGTLYLVVRDFNGIDWPQQFRLFAMFVWLPLAALPYVFTLGWSMSFGVLMTLIRLRQHDQPVRWATRRAVAVDFNIHAYDLSHARRTARDLSPATTYRESLEVVRQFRRNLHDEDPEPRV